MSTDSPEILLEGKSSPAHSCTDAVLPTDSTARDAVPSADIVSLIDDLASSDLGIAKRAVGRVPAIIKSNPGASAAVVEAGLLSSLLKWASHTDDAELQVCTFACGLEEGITVHLTSARNRIQLAALRALQKLPSHAKHASLMIKAGTLPVAFRCLSSPSADIRGEARSLVGKISALDMDMAMEEGIVELVDGFLATPRMHNPKAVGAAAEIFWGITSNHPPPALPAMRMIFPACVTVLQLGLDYDDAIAYILCALRNVVKGGASYVQALIGSGAMPFIVKALSYKQDDMVLAAIAIITVVVACGAGPLRAVLQAGVVERLTLLRLQYHNRHDGSDYDWHQVAQEAAVAWLALERAADSHSIAVDEFVPLLEPQEGSGSPRRPVAELPVCAAPTAASDSVSPITTTATSSHSVAAHPSTLAQPWRCALSMCSIRDHLVLMAVCKCLNRVVRARTCSLTVGDVFPSPHTALRLVPPTRYVWVVRWDRVSHSSVGDGYALYESLPQAIEAAVDSLTDRSEPSGFEQLIYSVHLCIVDGPSVSILPRALCINNATESALADEDDDDVMRRLEEDLETTNLDLCRDILLCCRLSPHTWIIDAAQQLTTSMNPRHRLVIATVYGKQPEEVRVLSSQTLQFWDPRMMQKRVDSLADFGRGSVESRIVSTQLATTCGRPGAWVKMQGHQINKSKFCT